MSEELMMLATERAKTDALVRDLLAENQRLIAERPKVYASGMSDGRNGTPCEAIRMEHEILALRERAEAAEARLRDLANANPVAIVIDHDSHDHNGHRFMVIDWSEPMLPIGTRLIRRPTL